MKTVHLLFIPVFIIALGAITIFIRCGGGPEMKKITDLTTSDLWLGTRIEMPGLSSSARKIFGSNIRLSFQKNGKCIINISGKDYNAKWKLKGDEIYIRGKEINTKGDFNLGSPFIEDDIPILKLHNIHDYFVIFYREKDILDD